MLTEAEFKIEMNEKFHLLYEEHNNRLRNWLKSKLNDDNDVDDVMQDAWLKIWERIIKLPFGEMNTAYLYSCLKSCLYDFFRRRGDGKDPSDQKYKKGLGKRYKLQMTGNKDFLRNLKGYWAERVIHGDTSLLKTCRELFGEADSAGVMDPTGSEKDDWALAILEADDKPGEL